MGIQDGEALKNVLQYFCNSTEENVTDDNVRRLNDLVARVKARKEVSKQYMITLFRDQSIRDEARSEAWDEAWNEARDETLRRLNKLTLLLIESERYDDLKRSAKDPAYQEQLLREFGIIQ